MRHVRSGEGRATRSGVVTEVKQDLPAFGRNFNFDINVGMAPVGDILMFTWGELLQGESLVLILGWMRERYAVPLVPT